MLKYYLFQDDNNERIFEVAVIATSLAKATQILKERYRNASRFSLAFQKPADGLIITF